MRSAGLLLILCFAQPAVAQRSLSSPLGNPSPPVWHGWLYDDGSLHRGIDYIVPLGTPVVAADDGIAMSSVQPINPAFPNKDAYGNFVLIQHANGLSTLYAHLSSSAANIFSTANRYNVNFSSWTPVKRGDVIGFVGTSGVVTTAVVHLHFEAAINPGGDYLGHVAGKTDPYAILNIALYYPPSGPKFTRCGANFLWIACPLTSSVIFLTFTEGDPGVPGDGIFVNAGGPFNVTFDLATPFSLNGVTNGVTVTVFLAPNQSLQNVQLNFQKLGTSCGAGLGAGTVTAVSFNGVTGFSNSIPQDALQLALSGVNQFEPGCSTVTLSDLSVVQLIIHLANGQIGTTLDAAAITLGQNTFPSPQCGPDAVSGQTFQQAFDSVALSLRAGSSPPPQPWFENRLLLSFCAGASSCTSAVAANFTSVFISGTSSDLCLLLQQSHLLR